MFLWRFACLLATSSPYCLIWKREQTSSKSYVIRAEDRETMSDSNANRFMQRHYRYIYSPGLGYSASSTANPSSGRFSPINGLPLTSISMRVLASSRVMKCIMHEVRVEMYRYCV